MQRDLVFRLQDQKYLREQPRTGWAERKTRPVHRANLWHLPGCPFPLWVNPSSIRQSTSLLPTFSWNSSSSLRRGGKEHDLTVTAAEWWALAALSPNPTKLQQSFIQIFIRKASEKQQTQNYWVLLWKPFYYNRQGSRVGRWKDGRGAIPRED